MSNKGYDCVPMNFKVMSPSEMASFLNKKNNKYSKVLSGYHLTGFEKQTPMKNLTNAHTGSDDKMNKKIARLFLFQKLS